ncbi:peptidyl-prolyl cis-trans isomerase [Sulfuricaulis sp.]|jgi:hypothetical protein|uniref:peptidylprolyl isomerase n=1 Tax=Sulfuricaulis sp. TaxID=2003553 RepID=UPI003559F0CD
MRKLLKEPLLHFLVLGALLFAGYEVMNRRGEPEAGRIVVTQGQIDNLRASFSRVWQHPPTPSEMDGLIQDYIREEVLAREAMTLGLDRDDTVIRRRLRQKMEFIANDLSAPVEPGETELEAFLAKHLDLFLVEPRFTFRQVYLNAGQRGDVLQRDATRLLAELNQPGAKADYQTLGDATMLNPELTDVPAGEITRQFGEKFTRQLEQLPTGRWHGPVISGYGAHLVLVEDRTPGRMPKLAEVREQVAREWADACRREDNEKFYQKLLKHYSVTIEGASSGAHANILAAQAK